MAVRSLVPQFMSSLEQFIVINQYIELKLLCWAITKIQVNQDKVRIIFNNYIVRIMNISHTDRFFYRSKNNRKAVNTSQLHVNLSSRSPNRKHSHSKSKNNRLFEVSNRSSQIQKFIDNIKLNSTTNQTHSSSSQQFVPPIAFHSKHKGKGRDTRYESETNNFWKTFGISENIPLLKTDGYFQVDSKMQSKKISALKNKIQLKNKVESNALRRCQELRKRQDSGQQKNKVSSENVKSLMSILSRARTKNQMTELHAEQVLKSKKPTNSNTFRQIDQEILFSLKDNKEYLQKNQKIIGILKNQDSEPSLVQETKDFDRKQNTASKQQIYLNKQRRHQNVKQIIQQPKQQNAYIQCHELPQLLAQQSVSIAKDKQAKKVIQTQNQQEKKPRQKQIHPYQKNKGNIKKQNQVIMPKRQKTVKQTTNAQKNNEMKNSFYHTQNGQLQKYLQSKNKNEDKKQVAKQKKAVKEVAKPQKVKKTFDEQFDDQLQQIEIGRPIEKDKNKNIAKVNDKEQQKLVKNPQKKVKQQKNSKKEKQENVSKQQKKQKVDSSKKINTSMPSMPKFDQQQIENRNTKKNQNQIKNHKQKQSVRQQFNQSQDQESLQQFQQQLQQMSFFIYLLGEYLKLSKSFYEKKKVIIYQKHKINIYYMIQQMYHLGSKALAILKQKNSNLFWIPKSQLTKPQNKQIINRRITDFKSDNDDCKKNIKFYYQSAKVQLSDKQRVFSIDGKNNYHEKCLVNLKKEFKQIQQAYKLYMKNSGDEKTITQLQQRLCYLIQTICILKAFNGQRNKQYENVEQIEDLQGHYQKFKHYI